MFTNENKTSNVNHVIFVIHSVISECEDEQDTWTDGREYVVIADNELGLTVHSFPTNPQHILNVGREVCIPADRDLLSILSLSDLLTEEHDLTIEDLVLTITKEREECFKEISPVPEPLILETEIPGWGTGVNPVFFGYYASPHPPQCRAGWELIS